MSCSREATGYARFVDGKWLQIYTTCSDVGRTVEIGGNNPMPVYLFAALVTDLGIYMQELGNPIMNSPWKQFAPAPKNIMKRSL